MKRIKYFRINLAKEVKRGCAQWKLQNIAEENERQWK